MTHYLYRHIRPDTNEVFYVGVGASNSRRAWETRRRNSHWVNIVNINSGNFRVDILLEDLTDSIADDKELEFIKLYGRRIDNTGTLVNVQVGGKNHSGYKMSDKQKEELGIRVKGNSFAKGRKHTEEERFKMKLIRAGRTPNKGMRWITDGIQGKMINKDAIIPTGWRLGSSKNLKNKINKQV